MGGGTGAILLSGAVICAAAAAGAQELLESPGDPAAIEQIAPLPQGDPAMAAEDELPDAPAPSDEDEPDGPPPAEAAGCAAGADLATALGPGCSGGAAPAPPAGEIVTRDDGVFLQVAPPGSP